MPHDRKSKRKKDYTESPQRLERIISISSRGIGFVKAKHLDEEDIKIPSDALNTALHGDTVEIALHPHIEGEQQKGEVYRVISRARESFVGVIDHEEGVCFLSVDDRRMYINILIPEAKTMGATTGIKVLAKITKWTDPKKNPEGEVIKILGPKGEHDVEMHAIILEHGFETKFPSEVEQEAQALTKEITPDEISRRHDMRGIPTLTIDPLTAKDFDDALSINVLGNGDTEIGIHIADVSHYVTQGGVIDKEAQKRATSVYLVDRTIPMLPEKLSNNICSLNPNEDRLAFSAIFTFSKNSTIKDQWFGETVIHSNYRFTYEAAQKILDAKQGVFHTELEIINTLAKKLKEERFKKGGIEFDQDEIGFELDDNGKPIKIFKKKRLDTNRLIEEFMLLANRKVAEHVYNICKKSSGRDTVFVYRVHDVPDPEKIEELSIFLSAIGHDLETENGYLSARDINKLFKEIKGRPEENLIKTATIRSMAKAVYSTKNIGHFGLAFKYYTHFTSPIRRYPDIMVHRILKHNLLEGKKLSDETFVAYEKLAISSSQREVEAIRAERDSIKYKQVEYMQDYIGKIFEGVITGVTEWGVYVEEKKTLAEGLVRASAIGGDFYTLNRKNYSLVGERTKKKYSLGDTVNIKLIKADLESKTLDFVFV